MHASFGLCEQALKSYSERRQEPLTAAWLKVIDIIEIDLIMFGLRGSE
jgi:hypothetical protein